VPPLVVVPLPEDDETPDEDDSPEEDEVPTTTKSLMRTRYRTRSPTTCCGGCARRRGP